jgi:lipopolysaccharide transport system ATP-binding protein
MNMPTAYNPVGKDDAQPAIWLDSVSVEFRVPREQLSGIKEYTIRWLQRRVHYHHFLALKDINLQIQPGEIFGIVGRNGAGKSTLLKLMARVLKPTRGRVVMRGKTAPLLELGSGFHPELTGRENIFFNGALLGYSRKEINTSMAEMIAFAEIDEFIDSPLRTYSTGMVARLGFAVATHTRPDILLIDEVLSVGDIQFQEKCLQRMQSFRQQGTTIVLVSHSMARIRDFCQRAAWLDGGQMHSLGAPENVVAHYLQSLE